ncbi:TonB-dependent receptor domain-containing protein [Aliidiomarina sp.]|uniref:TonB-dependent receptor domain-containing protein n=1 Tax=Aliidiomarina sp. TaxID=1872439 RepID=UPI003A4E5177
MYTNSKVAKSVRLALMFGASATAFAGIAQAQEQEQEEEQAERVERIQVTGSRISRSEMEGALPVTTISREDIDLSGETSVADLLRGTTFNTSGSFRPQSGSAAQGTATVSLRGLGASRTLVLLDGRRLPTSPSTGSSQDLNIVPMAAVERIEILSDGASAVYGSDAIGGVINIVTRRDFNGVEARYGRSTVSLPSDGGDREEGSIVFGSSSDTTRVIGGVSWNNRDIIFENAYKWVQPGTSIYGNNVTETDNSGGFRAADPSTCADTVNFRLTGAANTCAYNFNATNANEASTGNQGLFLKADHDINDDWNVFMNASYARAKSFGRYAPSLNDPGSTLNASSLNNPTNPDSPFYNPGYAADGRNIGVAAYNSWLAGDTVFAGDNAVTPRFNDEDELIGGTVTGNRDMKYWHRFASIGNRDSYVDNTSTDLLFGAQGRIGEVDVDFGARTSSSKTFDIGYNYLLRTQADNLVNNASFTGIYYDLRDPLGSRYTSEADQNAYAQLINSMNVTISRVSQFDQREIFGSASFDVMDTNAGMIQAAVGFEYREEDYVDQYDALSEAGSVGGSAGNSAGGGRDVTSGYFEVLVPVTYDFELNFAGRFDEYSDYGSDFSPKASFRWTPTDTLLVRGSWGEGFRAPSLDIITQAPSSGNPSVSDPATCLNFSQAANCAVQVRQETRANPDLESEQSTQMSLGVAYQPADWFNFSLDYWKVEITNRIASFGAGNLLTRERLGQNIPAGLGIIRNTNVDFTGQVPAGSPVNPIVLVNGGFGNDGSIDIEGFDFNARTNFDFGQYGRLNQNLQVAYTRSFKVDGGTSFVGEIGDPKYRATLQNVYSISDFDIAWNMNVIGDQQSTTNPDDYIATWITNDIQVTYNTSWNGRLTVGAQNAFAKEPQLRAFGGRSYNFNLYNAFGRVTYFRYTQKF